MPGPTSKKFKLYCLLFLLIPSIFDLFSPNFPTNENSIVFSAIREPGLPVISEENILQQKQYLPIVVNSPTIFQDNFSTGWTPLPETGSTSGLENNQYFLNHTVPGRIVRSVATHPSLPNVYSVEVTAQWINGSGKYGLTFEWQNALQFYVLIADPASQTYELRVFNNGWTILTSGTYPAFPLDHLKIERNRTTGAISLYLNNPNTPLQTITDSTYLNGSAGLELWSGVSTSPANLAKASFDNFAIPIVGFQDGFIEGWTPLPESGATSGLENNQYFLTHTIPNRIVRSIASHPPLPDSYAVKVDVQLVAGSGKFGLTFEWQTPQQFYVFVVDPQDQTYELRIFNNGWTTLTSGTFNAPAPYHLKVERDRATGMIQLYMNDMLNPLTSIFDTSYMNGSVGLELWSSSDTSATIPVKGYFDNFELLATP